MGGARDSGRIAGYAAPDVEAGVNGRLPVHTDFVEGIDYENAHPEAPFLRVDSKGLALIGDGMLLRVDYARMLPRLAAENLHAELLVRAAKVRTAGDETTAFDATAGLGEDSLLLAAAGFRVQLCESNPIIFSLLDDALRRASADPRLVATVGRMHALEADSLEVLAHLSEPPDVIYLDPMFPKRTKSAAVKKKFQLLHLLEPPCQDPEALLRAAITAGPRKVVIKRPLKGPCLAGLKPSYSLRGKSVRYDCIVISRAG